MAAKDVRFSTDAREGPILAQSWYVLDRIRLTVEAAGGGMSDVFKLVQYFKDLDHFPHYSRVRKLFFPGEPPASDNPLLGCRAPGLILTPHVAGSAWDNIANTAQQIFRNIERVLDGDPIPPRELVRY